MELSNVRQHVRTGWMLLFMIAILWLSSGLAQPAYAGARPEPLNKHILYISSYSYDWPSSKLQIDGFEDRIGDMAQIRYFFMDTKHLEPAVAEEEIYRDVSRAMATDHFDIVVLADDAALDFVTKYKNVLFQGMPVVFAGINSDARGMAAAKDPDLTGLIELYVLSETIRLGEHIQPNAKRIVAIMDNTITGQGSYDQFRAQEKNFPELAFENLNTSEMTRKEIVDKVSSYGDDTILLYLLFTEDKDGYVYGNAESTRLISDSAHVPLYKADEMGIGDGAVGGYVLSFVEMGRTSGDMAIQILNGVKPSEIPVRALNGNFTFDARVLKRFGIDKGILPKNSIYVHDEPDFFTQHKHVIMPLAMVIIFMGIIMASMSHNSMHRRRLHAQLMEKDMELMVAIRHAGVRSWVYDPLQHIAWLTGEDPVITRLFGSKGTIDNYPQVLYDLDFIHPDDQATFKAAFEQIDQGSEKVAFEARVRSQQGYQWERIHMTSIYDQGRRIKVIGTSLNISKQKEAENRFHNFTQTVLPENGKFIGTIRLNLTKDSCGDANGFYRQVRSQAQDGTVDGFFQCTYLLNPNISDLSEFRKHFNKDNLLQAFHQGTTEINCEHRLRIEGEREQWVKTFIHMTENPSNGDVEGILYSLDIHEQKILRAVVDDAVSHDYDFLAFIDGKTELLSVYRSKTGVTVPPVKNQDTYSETVSQVIAPMVAEEERERLCQQLDLATVAEALSSEPDYFVYFTVCAKGGFKAKKKLRYSYIDRGAFNLLMTETDITDVYER